MKKLKTMDLILIIVGVLLLLFTVTMIVIYLITGDIPETLCTCFFTTIGGECGVLGWIKATKIRNKERQYELEDRKYHDERNDKQ